MATNLDQAITVSGLTNREVGDRIGKTEHQVWRWRRGKHLPELDVLVALAGLLTDGDVAAFYTEPVEDEDRSAA